MNLYVGSIEVTGTKEEKRVLQFFDNLKWLIDLRTFNIAIDYIPENLFDAIRSIFGKLSVPEISIRTPIAKVDIKQSKKFFSKLDFLNLKKMKPVGYPYAYRVYPRAIQNSKKIGEFSLEYTPVSSLSQIFENSTNLKTLYIETTFLDLLPLKHQNVRCWKGLKNLLIKSGDLLDDEYCLSFRFSGLYNFLLEVTGLENIFFEVSLTDKESVEGFTRLHQLKCMKSIQSYSLNLYYIIESKLEPLWTDLFKELSSFRDLKSLKLSIHFKSFISLSFLERLLQHLTKLECLVFNIIYHQSSFTEKIDFSIPFGSLPELRIFQFNLEPDLSVTASQSLLEGLGKLRKIHTIEISNGMIKCPANFLKAKITQIFKLKSVKKVRIHGTILEKPEGEELTLGSFFSL